MVATEHHTHTEHKHHWMRYAAIGSALAAGAVVVSPYVLPVLGVGSMELAEESMLALHGSGAGNGLAGAVNSAINAIPLVGSSLASGGLATAATSGVIGIGGVLLGRYVNKRDDGTKQIRWGNVIKTAALLTSAMIALPSILTGISTGIVYLAAVTSGVELASSAVALMSKTIGSIGAASMAAAGVSGAALTLPHLLTCGASIASVTAAWGVSKADNSAKHIPILHTHRQEEITVSITPDQPTSAGVPCEATITLHDAKTGLPISADQLAITHTKKLHLLVVDQSLKDYHHIHPTPAEQPGSYRFTFTPKTANSYSAWADFTLNNDRKSHQIKTTIQSSMRRNIKPSIRRNSSAEVANMRFDWSGAPLQKNTPSIVEVNISDTAGKPVSDLEPVMGAYAHLVGFSADGKSLIHCHPLGSEPKTPQDRGGPNLRFHVEAENDGPIQFYLQIRRNGEDIYVPFGKEIGKNASFSSQIGLSRATMANHSHAH